MAQQKTKATKKPNVRKLSAEQLKKALGGDTAPVDPAQGLPTGKRMHKP